MLCCLTFEVDGDDLFSVGDRKAQCWTHRGSVSNLTKLGKRMMRHLTSRANVGNPPKMEQCNGAEGNVMR